LRADWDVSSFIGGSDPTFTVLGALQRFRANDRFNADGVNAVSIDYVQDTRTNAHNMEARLSGRVFNDTVNYVAGVFHSQDSVADVRDSNQSDLSPTAGGLVIAHAGTDGRQDGLTDAVFGQVEWQASDAFKYTLGLRYSRESRDLAACSRDKDGDLALLFNVLSLAQQLGLSPVVGAGLNNQQVALLGDIATAMFDTGAPGEVLAPLVQQAYALGLADIAGPLVGGPSQGDCITIDSETGKTGKIQKSLDEDNVSGRAAVDWTPADHIRVYGSFSVGYKSGSYTLVPASNDHQYDPVVQERINAYEIGFKGRVADDVQVNAAVFHYDYYDKQLFTYYFDQVFGALQKLANVPKSRVDGAELEVQVTPAAVPGLFTSLGVTFLDTEVKEYTGLGPFGEPDTNYAGSELTFSPPWEVTAVVNWLYPAFDWGSIVVGGDGSFTDDQEADLANNARFHLDSYYLLNARLGLKAADDRWSVTAFCRNLTDEVYYNTKIRTADTMVRYAGMPRTFGVTMSVSFE
jgi:outer membrane receptor protein involved in Fe transport